MMGSPASYFIRICEIIEIPSQDLNRIMISGKNLPSFTFG